MSAPYVGSGYAYNSTATTSSQVASEAVGDSITTTYSVRYLGNISNTTNPGAYATDLTYVITVNF